MSGLRFDTRASTAAACGAAIALLMSMRPLLQADQEPDAVPRLLSYSGTLSQGGEAVNGAATLTFRVYDVAENGSALWTETLAVSVYHGRFTATLGQTDSSIIDVVQTSDDLYLEVAIETSGGAITLNDRQRFVPAPYANWASAGSSAFQSYDGITLTGDKGDGATTAPLVVRSGTDDTLLWDTDAIDSTSDTLEINGFSNQGVSVGGSLDVGGAWTVGDTLIIGGAEALRASTTVLSFNPDSSASGTQLSGDLVVTDDAATSSLQPEGMTVQDVTVTGQATFEGATTVGALTLTGDLTVTGTANLGVYHATCSGWELQCACNDGYVLLGGGVLCDPSGDGTNNTTDGDQIEEAFPKSDTRFEINCLVSGKDSTKNYTAYIVCARLAE